MAQTTEIAWCDSTFNPWIGCTKVSPGCANCYAERDFDLRKHVAKWGAGQPRHRTSAAYWRQPLKWDKEAATRALNHEDETNLGKDLGVYQRPRIFCASLSDWLDDEVPIEWLADLLDLILRTPHLDWLLLTKRPENWRERIEKALAYTMMDAPIENDSERAHDRIQRHPLAVWIQSWVKFARPPANVWIGTTVEDQARADERIPELLSIPARVRFLSMEPLLGVVDISGLIHVSGCYFVDWVICGGESGPNARPMHSDWARSLRDQCAAAGVPFLFKQWGEWAPADGTMTDGCGPKYWHQWAAGGFSYRNGKQIGRLLDGRVHLEFPAVSTS